MNLGPVWLLGRSSQGPWSSRLPSPLPSSRQPRPCVSLCEHARTRGRNVEQERGSGCLGGTCGDFFSAPHHSAQQVVPPQTLGRRASARVFITQAAQLSPAAAPMAAARLSLPSPPHSLLLTRDVWCSVASAHCHSSWGPSADWSHLCVAAVRTPRGGVVGAFLASSPGWTELCARPPCRSPGSSRSDHTWLSLGQVTSPR